MVRPSGDTASPTFSVARIAVAATIAASVVALGVVAGLWQFGRYQVRADALSAAQAAQRLPVVPWSHVVTGSELPEWRTVTLTGHFESESVTALRGRTVEREATLQYLVWFISENRAVLVNAGWVPREAALDVALPTGEVTLEGTVRAQEPDDGKRGEGATRITALQMPTPSAAAQPGWLMVREPCDEAGCLGTPLQPVPPPQLSLGPHLSYAFQWWLLAAAAPVITVAVLRRDARHAGERALEGTRAAPRLRREPRRARQLSDEEIEDAL